MWRHSKLLSHTFSHLPSAYLLSSFAVRSHLVLTPSLEPDEKAEHRDLMTGFTLSSQQAGWLRRIRKAEVTAETGIRRASRCRQHTVPCLALQVQVVRALCWCQDASRSIMEIKVMCHHRQCSWASVERQISREAGGCGESRLGAIDKTLWAAWCAESVWNNRYTENSCNQTVTHTHTGTQRAC